MTIRKKLFLVFTLVVILVVTQGVMDWQYAADDGQKAHWAQFIILVILVSVTLAVLIAGFAIAKEILTPLEQLVQVAKEVADGNHDRRLKFTRTDEFGIMAGAFDNMLDALQKTTISRNELESEIKVRRVVEAELRAGENYLAIILNSIGDGVLVTNAEGRVLRMNPVAEQLTGWTNIEALSQPVNEVFRVIDGTTRQPVLLPVAEVMAERKITSLGSHAMLIDRSGAEHSVADSCAPIRDMQGNVLGAVHIFRDVTEERRAKEQIIQLNRELEQRVESRTTELRESERRHRTLLANLQGMAYRCRNESDWPMEFVSEGCRELLGLAPEDLTSGLIDFNGLIHPEDRERVWREVQSAVAKQSVFTLEYRVQHASGEWRSVWEQGQAIANEQGQVAALEGYVTDITQRIQAEQARAILENQLRRSQKMEAIGTLAGGIAHDFNNILAAILGSAELIKMDMGTTHPSREFLDQIFVASHRASEVVKQILTLSQRRESERSIIHLQASVKECLKLLRATIPAMVDISSQIDAQCPPVLTDPTQIHQVIMNLGTNAWHALPETGGSIKVSLEPFAVDKTFAAQHPELRPGLYVRLSVSDNGRGMNESTLERIFEPFFTTKPAGRGTGLGLSVVHGIVVKANKGAILVESQLNKGTTFHIYLPAQSQRETTETLVDKEFTRGNNERILLADDDVMAGQAMENVLKHMGYRVRWFKLPEEALADFQVTPSDYDLVISDLAMPGMSGDNLAAAMLKIRPGIPVLLTTGQIDPDIEKRARELGVCNVLLKPIPVEILGREMALRLAKETDANQTTSG